MRSSAILLTLLAAAAPLAESRSSRPFTVDDALSIGDVSSPRVSPDGASVVYVVSGLDLEKDVGFSNLYEVPFTGGDAHPLTVGKSSNSHPRFSPDGRFVAFLSDREGDTSQVWLLDRRGGEPRKLSAVEGGVTDFEWSPGAEAIVLVSRDPDPNRLDGDDEKSETKPPLVITRLQFKRDGRGYLDERRTHLYVLDVASGRHRRITEGPYDDSQPAWSPDGREIAFVSNRSEDPDANDDTDIFLVPAGGGEPRRLTDHPGADSAPAWSPDGRWVAYVTVTEPELIWYATNHLAVTPADGGRPRVLTARVDRNVGRPSFAPDGSLHFLLEDSANQHLARVELERGEIHRIASGERDVREHHTSASGKTALVVSSPHLPAEVFALAPGGEPSRLTRTNESLLADVRLGEVENVHFRSDDGTEIEGFVTKPPGFQPGRRYPTLLWIHGGPVSQYSTAFNEIWQVFAGAGYVVVSANPRGSSGYGQEFSRAIWADWGNRDFEDVNAAVDHAIEKGYADPERLGVGGWSYGGILTNYVITKTDRFAAAVSGASETNYIACYGTDHYQHEWEKELGLPWENQELYMKLSPLTYVGNVVTPTLVLCGEHDWNVPLNQSEQLYQSLRRLGVDTMLVIYPGQSHGIRKPSYQKDRYERYLAWFDRFLGDGGKGSRPTTGR